MFSNPVKIRFTGTDSVALAAAREAAHLAFPASVQADAGAGGFSENTVSGLEQAGPDLEIQANAESGGRDDGADSISKSGWPVVKKGVPAADQTLFGTGNIEVISAGEWRPAVLARVMRGAVRQNRMERENTRLRGDLMTMARRIGHDLRSPLGGILSTAELLSEELSEIDPEQAALTRPLFDSADTLMKLIERMSLVARASTRTETVKRVSMEEAWWNARQRLERRILKEGAGLSEPNAWPDVAGVQPWIEAVWLNLLTNALEHGATAAGPAQISVGWQAEGADGFRFWVRDTGKGVPEERRAGLFHPFHRMHEPGSPRGLGLAVVQHLTALQSGRCGYEPVPDGGGRFYFILPAADRTQEAKAAAESIPVHDCA